MADGSRDDRTDPKLMNDLTFSAPDTGHGDSKKCSEQTFDGDRMKLSFYKELDTSDSCEKSGSRGVAADDSAAVGSAGSEKSSIMLEKTEEDRKKRCFDRYDSSESSDSGVAVLSPSESSGSGSSDITEPASPRSPESCGAAEEAASARMPPWASEPAPAARRLAAQPAPVRRSNPPLHRRITEFFNHKMKPQNGLKRDCSTTNNDDTKKKCLPKNGVTHDLEKYISYLSQTLSPKVLLDVSKQAAAEAHRPANGTNGTIDTTKSADLSKTMSTQNGLIDYSRPRDNKEKIHTTMNGFVEIRHGADSSTKDKPSNGHVNGFMSSKTQKLDYKMSPNPSANGISNYKKLNTDVMKRKVPIPASNELAGIRIAPATSMSHSPKKLMTPKPDTTRMNGVVSSTTKLDSRMNGVTLGSNNLSLNPISSKPLAKKEAQKKAQPAKRTNRKSSACIANSKNLTWSKANNLKQVQLQKQNCANSVQSTVKSLPGESPSAPNMNVPNGVRQVPMTLNGNIVNNLNVPVTNFQNCHQINITQPCNGTVTSTNLGSFVAVPQNVMLTTLRIPQNGLPAQTLTNHQPNNINAFNRTSVNVPSPTKLNGQFVFPIMQNINGAVVQIPNLMAKMPNFVLPQTSQLTAQRHDHLQNQQILINGTLLKLANTMPPTYGNVNKPAMPATSQPGISVVNKNITGMPTVGMTVQPKPNYTVNLSHSVLVPQPGFIVTSVPNMNVKETWSSLSTNPAPSSQTSCSNTIVHQPPPIVGTFAATNLHTSSIPIAPVKPPDNPIQGTEPPSSTVKEPEGSEVIQKCDFPWITKTFNNNIVPLDCNKKTLRPFAEVSGLSAKLEDYCSDDCKEKVNDDNTEKWNENSMDDLRKVEEVAKREDTIFTQITVLKDVSSNVQSSMIEANFCSTTTESSESGIGTDKSIDSPASDSQTSKECDDDSSLSLSISVSSVEVQSSQISPILKEPKTLRFPPRKPTKASSDKRTSSTDTTSSVTVCLWENCKQEFESDTDILEHLQSIHVESQAGRENYVCQWERCKVRGKPSCSRLWLERHALSHGGNKPFKCIVDGCGRRFSTQILLERHVNNHFNEVSPNTNGTKKAADSAPKLIRRNGKKLRYRRQPWSARMFDFFDSGIMERLAWQLSRGTRWRLGGGCPLREPAGRHTLTLHAAVTATRYNAAAACTEALVSYYPPHVLDDEWVPAKDVRRIKRVEMASLPAHTKVFLYEQFCASYRKLPPPPPPRPRAAPAPAPARTLPPRHCTSSRLLNNLLAKKKKIAESRDDCNATDVPLVYREEDKTDKVEVSGAQKRKQGRRHGGNAFWPCGR